MVKVSIIMPIYNDEDYLDKSINSIINQSLKDIELICIDDGSTDNSLKILKDLEKKYNFIKIISQENKGAGKARNTGLKIAKGEYIAFLDSDDIFIDSTALEKMYNYGIEEDAIMISANIKALNNGELIDHHIYKSKRCTYFSEKKLVKSDDYGIPWYFYKNMFKRSFLVENNIYFPDLRRGQDPIFLVKTLANIKEFAALPIYLYGYNVSSGGGAGNKVNTYRKKLDYITHFKKTFDILEEANYTNSLSIYKKSLFQYLSSYDNEKDKDYYDIVNDTFGGMEYFKDDFKEEYYLFLLNQLLNQVNESNFKDIKEKVENLKIENYEFIPSDLFIFYKNILYSETFKEYDYINKLKKKHEELLLKNKKLRKRNKKLNKKLKRLNKINKEILSSNSWKITKPLRIIGSFRSKNVTFTEKILEHSNSYNFYKGGYKKLTKKNEKLTKKNEKLEYKLNFEEDTSNFKSRTLLLTLNELNYTRNELNKVKEELLLMKYNYASLKESEVNYKDLKTINIGYILQSFPTLSETFVLNELKWLKEKGYNVKVFTYRKPEKLVEDLGFDLEIIHFDFRDDLMDTLEKLLVIHEIDLMHTHFAYPTCNTYTYPLAEKLQIPFTFFAHAFDIFIKENIKRNQIKEVTNSKYCKGVFTLSNFHKNHLIEHGVPEDKIIITRQATDYEIKPLEYKPKEIKRIVSISRFVEKKGLDDLIQAAKLLEDENYIFEMYGFGRLQDELEEQIEELNLNNISIKGSLDNPTEVVNTFKKSDLLVSPCKVAENGDMDGIPTVIFEAMAYGLPVLTTDVSAIPEVIEDGKNGFITSQNNPEALASKIKEISKLSNEELFEIVKTAQKDVKEISSVDKTMNTVLNTWKNI